MTEPIRQEILAGVQRLGELAPELRFGQLIANLAFDAEGPSDEALWNMDDEKLLEALRKQIADFARRSQQSVA